MAQYTDPGQLDGLFKEVYGDDVISLVPDSAKLVKTIGFVSADKELGNKYHQPVVLSNEHGITYAAADAGAFALNNSVALTMKDAQVQGSQMVLRSSMSYDAAARASNSKKAFVKGTELLVENMLETMTKRLELQLLYGASAEGLGRCDSSVGPTDGNYTVTMVAATWAAGIWAGAENAEIDFFDGPSTTALNTSAAITIVSVDLDNKAITYSGANAATVHSFINSDGSDATCIRWRGAISAEMSGIDKIITNSGSLFGINAGTYNLWKGNSYAVGAALTIGKVLGGISRAVERGLDEDVALYINPLVWKDLNSDLAGLRRFDSSFKEKGIAGNRSIQYHGQNGIIDIIAHNCVKQSEGFALPTKKAKRIGAVDITFKRPGGGGDQMFRELSSNAGFELRSYTDQAVFIETPARCVKFTGITVS
jgi:hypothetical protein